MSLYTTLAMYESDLEKIQTALSKLERLINQVGGLKSNTMDVITVNNKPYKDELVDNSIYHLIKARDYLSSNSIPALTKKIDDIKEEIARMEEEERRLREEGLA